MGYSHSYLDSATKIISRYKGEEPLALFLKKYFATQKKHGSRDRKQIAHLCYCYFRMGKTAMKLPVQERILTGLFLYSSEPNEQLQELKPDWNEQAGLSLAEKASIAGVDLASVFPWKEELSEPIDHEAFSSSFFVQPDLFLRIRPSHKDAVILKLDREGLEYEFIPPAALRLPAGFKADEHISLNKEAVVQDLSSQRVAEFLDSARNSSNDPSTQLRVWDCCAASGGKSILAKDVLGNIDLTVSDVRENILANLKRRFKEAGINNYRSFVADLTYDSGLKTKDIDLIIADVPCTGSGTWSRTPEQLYFFDEKKTGEYADLQKKILKNISGSIKPGGNLLYITCSVFKKENEEAVTFIEKEFHLRLLKMELLKGYQQKADTMFAAMFIQY